MIEKDILKKAANGLMFDMSDEEYKTLQNEFDVILKQMDLIDNIKDIEKVEPMFYPFDVTYTLREDDDYNNMDSKELFGNAKEVINNKVVVPKVVA